jgi:hypothetical protein
VVSENSGSPRNALASIENLLRDLCRDAELDALLLDLAAVEDPTHPEWLIVARARAQLKVVPLHEEEIDVDLQPVVEPLALEPDFVVVQLVRWYSNGTAPVLAARGEVVPPSRKPSLYSAYAITFGVK